MFVYRPPAEVLDDTLKKAFDLDRSLDDRFVSLLERIRMKERDGSETS